MGTLNVRDAMAAELFAQAETPVVETPITPAATPVAGETTTEDTLAKDTSSDEPDEDSFEDRADYKKALKEWTKKQTEAELRDAHKKEVDGYYADLRKARAQKRELNLKLEELNSRVSQSSKPVKPNIDAYSDPELYASDAVQYDRIIRKLEDQEAQAKSQAQASESNEIDAVWEHNAKASGLTDIDQVVAHVQQTGLLSPLPPNVQQDLVLSIAGPHMLRFLAMYPAFVDEIADSANPRLELKQLESMMLNSLRQNQTSTSAPTPAVVAPQAPAPAPKYAPAIVPKTMSSQTSSGPKKATQASSMEEFMRLRSASRKR